MTQAHTSDIDLAKMMLDSERDMRNPANPSFLATFNCQGQKVPEPIDSLVDALRSEEEVPPSILQHSAAPARDSISRFLNHPQLRAQIRKIVQKEARRMYVVEMDKS